MGPARRGAAGVRGGVCAQAGPAEAGAAASRTPGSMRRCQRPCSAALRSVAAPAVQVHRAAGGPPRVGLGAQPAGGLGPPAHSAPQRGLRPAVRLRLPGRPGHRHRTRAGGTLSLRGPEAQTCRVTLMSATFTVLRRAYSREGAWGTQGRLRAAAVSPLTGREGARATLSLVLGGQQPGGSCESPRTCFRLAASSNSLGRKSRSSDGHAWLWDAGVQGSSCLCFHEASSDSQQAGRAVTLWRDSSHSCFCDSLRAVPSPAAGRRCRSLTGACCVQRHWGSGHCHGGGSAAPWKRASVWGVRRWSEVSLSSVRGQLCPPTGGDGHSRNPRLAPPPRPPAVWSLPFRWDMWTVASCQTVARIPPALLEVPGAKRALSKRSLHPGLCRGKQVSGHFFSHSRAGVRGSVRENFVKHDARTYVDCRVIAHDAHAHVDCIVITNDRTSGPH